MHPRADEYLATAVKRNRPFINRVLDLLPRIRGLGEKIRGPDAGWTVHLGDIQALQAVWREPRPDIVQSSSHPQDRSVDSPLRGHAGGVGKLVVPDIRAALEDMGALVVAALFCASRVVEPPPVVNPMEFWVTSAWDPRPVAVVGGTYLGPKSCPSEMRSNRTTGSLGSRSSGRPMSQTASL